MAAPEASPAALASPASVSSGPAAGDLVLATSSGDAAACAWALESGALLHTFARSGATPRGGLCLLGPDHFAASESPLPGLRASPAIAVRAWHKKGAQAQESHTVEALGPLASTADGSFLFGGSASGRIYVWEVGTGRLLRSWAAHYKAVTALRLSADNTLLVSASDDASIHVTPLIRVLGRPSEDVRGSKLGSRSSASSGSSGASPSSAPTPLYKFEQHQQGITGLYTGRGGATGILVSCSTDHTCKVWNLALGQLQASYEFPVALQAVTVHPLEHSLYAGAGNGLIYRSALSFVAPTCDAQFEGHLKAVTALALNRSGAFLVSGSEDCTVRVWDSVSTACLQTLLQCRGAISSVIVLPRPPAWRSGLSSTAPSQAARLAPHQQLQQEQRRQVLVLQQQREADAGLLAPKASTGAGRAGLAAEELPLASRGEEAGEDDGMDSDESEDGADEVAAGEGEEAVGEGSATPGAGVPQPKAGYAAPEMSRASPKSRQRQRQKGSGPDGRAERKPHYQLDSSPAEPTQGDPGSREGGGKEQLPGESRKRRRRKQKRMGGGVDVDVPDWRNLFGQLAGPSGEAGTGAAGRRAASMQLQPMPLQKYLEAPDPGRGGPQAHENAPVLLSGAGAGGAAPADAGRWTSHAQLAAEDLAHSESWRIFWELLPHIGDEATIGSQEAEMEVLNARIESMSMRMATFQAQYEKLVPAALSGVLEAGLPGLAGQGQEDSDGGEEEEKEDGDEGS